MAGKSLIFDILANDKASGVIDKVGKNVDGQAGKWDKWKAAGVLGATAVAGAVVKFGADSISAYNESQTSQSKLTDAYARFPAMADMNIEKLRGINTELGKKTKFDDDATASGQAVLAGFKLTGKQMAEMTPLLQDYAAKTGKTLPDAAQDLGKAMQGQGKALKNIGLKFKDTGSAAGNYDQLMGGLRKQVGGFAEKEGQTAAGKAEILKNQFGELEETVGSKLAPAMSALTDKGLAVVDWMSKNGETITKLAIGVGVLALGFGVATAVVAAHGLAMAVAAAGGMGAWIAASSIGTAAQWLWNAALAANPIGLVVLAIAALVGGIIWVATKTTFFQTVWAKAWGGIKKGAAAVWTWVKSNWPLLLAIITGPIGLAVLAVNRNWDKIKAGAVLVKNWIAGQFNAVVTFVAGLQTRFTNAAAGAWAGIIGLATAAKNSIAAQFNAVVSFVSGLQGRFTNAAAGAWSGITGAATAAKTWVTDKWNAVVSFVGGLGSRITSAASGMWGGITTGFRAAINNIIRMWNDLSFTIGGATIFGKTFPSVTMATPNIPYLGDGGIVTRATLAMIGESGPEAVIPLRRLPRSTSASSGVSPEVVEVHVHVNGQVHGSTTELATAVLNGMQQLKGRGVRLGFT